jgi:hypothetical protein
VHLVGMSGAQTGPRYAMCDTNSQTRWKLSESPACETTSEDSSHGSVGKITLAQPVSMSDQGSLPRKEHFHRLTMKGYPNLVREVPTSPPIMVSTHEVNWNARTGDLAQEAKHSIMAGGNGRAPLEPKVKEIAIEEDQASRSSSEFEPSEKGGLHLGRGRSEVGIGGHVDRALGHGGQDRGEQGREGSLRRVARRHHGVILTG